jgi:ankyrin repeat protein
MTRVAAGCIVPILISASGWMLQPPGVLRGDVPATAPSILATCVLEPRWSTNDLAAAISAGDRDAVEMCIDRDPTCMDRPLGGALPLNVAIAHGHDPIVDLLLDRGASLDAEDAFGHRPLSAAVMVRDDVLVRRLLELGARVDARAGLGATPVHTAAYAGAAEVLRTLHGHGADPNARNDLWLTPLHFAAVQGREDVVAALLDLGADPDPSDFTGLTPLHLAAIGQEALDDPKSRPVLPDIVRAVPTGDDHAAIVRRLIERGADISARTESGMTPLACAARAGSREVVEILLSREADWRTADDNGFPPLHTAVAFGHAAVVELLLSHGADVHATVKDGRQPMHIVAQADHTEVAALLLVHGARIDAREPNGSTPLMVASIYGAVEMVSFLLVAGADAAATDEAGQTVLMAPSLGILLRPELEAAGRLQQATNMANAEEAAAITELLASHQHVDISSVDFVFGRTALHWAANAGAAKAVRLLVAHGAQIDRRDARGFTPLLLAISGARTGTAMLLLELGASASAKEHRAVTPLHLAAVAGDLLIAEELLARGADPNARDASRARPLRYAADARHDALCFVLARAGGTISNVALQDLRPRTLAHIRAGSGLSLVRRGRLSPAKAALEQAYPILERELGLAHGRTVESLEGLVALFEQEGNAGQAAEWAKQLEVARTFDATVISPDYLASTPPANPARDAVGVAGPRARRNGILALSEAAFGGKAMYVDLYRDALNDRAHDVRIAALHALARHGTAADAATIESLLTEHADESIRRAAAAALAAVQARAAGPPPE